MWGAIRFKQPPISLDGAVGEVFLPGSDLSELVGKLSEGDRVGYLFGGDPVSVDCDFARSTAVIEEGVDIFPLIHPNKFFHY